MTNVRMNEKVIILPMSVMLINFPRRRSRLSVVFHRPFDVEFHLRHRELLR